MLQFFKIFVHTSEAYSFVISFHLVYGLAFRPNFNPLSRENFGRKQFDSSQIQTCFYPELIESTSRHISYFSCIYFSKTKITKLVLPCNLYHLLLEDRMYSLLKHLSWAITISRVAAKSV